MGVSQLEQKRSLATVVIPSSQGNDARRKMSRWRQETHAVSCKNMRIEQLQVSAQLGEKALSKSQSPYNCYQSIPLRNTAGHLECRLDVCSKEEHRGKENDNCEDANRKEGAVMLGKHNVC